MNSSEKTEHTLDPTPLDSCCDTPRQRLDLTEKQAVQNLQYLDQWAILEENGIRKLWKTYKTSFDNGVRFANEIAYICHQFNHHPLLEITWSTTTVKWFTHSAGGLTDLDFASAEACDSIFESTSIKS